MGSGQAGGGRLLESQPQHGTLKRTLNPGSQTREGAGQRRVSGGKGTMTLEKELNLGICF